MLETWGWIDGGAFPHPPSPGRGVAFTSISRARFGIMSASRPKPRSGCSLSEGENQNKENDHGKAHGLGSARTDPVLDRVPQERRVDRALARQAPVYDLAGDTEPSHTQRQGLRMLEPPLREVRRLHAPVVRGDGLQGAREEQARLLRGVPRLPRGRLRAPLQGPVRLQRVRAREVLPAHEERGSTSPTGPRPRTAARS